MSLVFLDTETTGLFPDQDRLVELTYASEYSEPRTLYFGVDTVPSFVDDLIGFSKRGIAGKKSENNELIEFFGATENNTMVAANPAFDKAFLEANDLFRFHYRMLDIETFAMAKLGLPTVPGMKTVYDILTDKGYKITEPDHTSRNDVLAMRDAYKALRLM